MTPHYTSQRASMAAMRQVIASDIEEMANSCGGTL